MTGPDVKANSKRAERRDPVVSDRGRLRMRLLTVSLAGWLTGTIVYVLAAARIFSADSLAGLVLYGAFFSALPAIIAYWLILVPVFGVLRRRQAAPSFFVALAVGLCLCIAVLGNTLPSTATGPLSGEALWFYVVYGLIGIVLGGGYLWSHKGVPPNK